MRLSLRLLRLAAIALTIVLWQVTVAGPKVGPVTTVYAFDVTKLEQPEGLAIDKLGNIYVGLYPTGEIWKFSPDGTPSVFVTLDVGTGALVGLAVDEDGNLYACNASFVAGTHGIWKIDRQGNPTLFAALDPLTHPEAVPLTPYSAFGMPALEYGFPNGMAFDEEGALYVGDSYLALVWKITREGSASVWLQDPILDYICCYGANDIEFDQGSLFVTSTDQGALVRVKLPKHGQRPQAQVFVQDPSLIGADGLAFDVAHNVYVANDYNNTLLRISPEGVIAVLAGPDQGLDNVASTSFGQTHRHRTELYLTNFGGPTFSGATPNVPPSLQKIDVGVHGIPLP